MSQAAPTLVTTANRHPSVASLVIGASAGNLVEWFDWYIYSAMALYFAPVFFPPANTTVQLLNAAAVFAVGFLMRPLGGWLLGVYADRYGRKSGLLISVLMMSLGSFIIAVTPSYARIGFAAPVLLVMARLLQGLSVGGEYGASATYITEVAANTRRGFYSSFQAVTGIMGQLSALGVLVLLQRVFLTPAELKAWGWRIPFVLGSGTALVALALRRRLEETESFAIAQRRKANRDQWQALLRHPRQVGVVLGLTLGGIVAYYTYTTYAQKFLVNTAGFTVEQASAISAGTIFIYMLLQPIFAAASDRFGRRQLLIGFGVFGSLLTVPIMKALSQTKDVWAAAGLILVALVIVSGYTSINAVVKAELFPTEIRAVGVALPYAVTVSVFGGTAEYVALWLKNAGHEEWFYWYVSCAVLISLVVYLGMAETQARDLDA